MNERFEIIDEGSQIRIISPDDGSISTIISGPHGTHIEDAVIGAIRQQAHDIAELEVFAEIGRQWNADSLLAKWFPLTAERVEQDAQELVRLRADLAAAVSENAALLAANRDLKAHFDALKGDYDEAAHFARHFIRDDAAITPRGAIIRLGDKCTDLFVRLQQAEARLAAIEAAPTVAVVCSSHSFGQFVQQRFFGSQLPRIGTELIARPAKEAA